MPPSLSTSNRMYFVTFPECEIDELLIEEVTGHEAMSQLFEFRLRLLSESVEIDPCRLIAKPAILRIETRDPEHMGGERHWNGVVSRFQRTGRALSAEGHDVYTYECDIVPWFWFMTQHEDCRIFQNKTVREIVETIFGEFDYSDFRFDLTGVHPALEYCTQYSETTFAFISRLLEREGIHYYFLHNEDGGESRHILVLTDNNRGNPALDPHTIPYHQEGQAEEFDAIQALTLDQQMRTRSVTVRGWDYRQKALLSDNTPTMLGIGADRDLERYRYPGEYTDVDAPKRQSTIIMEAEEASHMRFRGNGQVRTLAPGHTFNLLHHPFLEFNIEYMVLAVWHHGRNNLINDVTPSDYFNEFTLQPHEVTWRAPLTTPKGLVRGPQTALVTGPGGEEIHTDEHGRIKIQFHWDRLGRYDDRSSCWVRVAQVWAGNGYGTLFIPRIGMEVVVSFLEGDPDQPIVTGCVYNGVNRPPQPLPQMATRSGIKTLSSKGGGGTNELGFEDKKGSEEVFLQAEKDFNVNVKNNHTQTIGADSDHHVKGNSRHTVDGNRDMHVTGHAYTIVTDDYFLGSEANLQLGSENETRLVARNQLLVASGPMGTMDINGGTQLAIEASVMISLKVGSSGIVIDQSGVSVVGPMIRQNSGGAPSAARSFTPFRADVANDAHSTDDGTVTDPIQQLQAQALRNAALRCQPFCAECEAARAAYAALMA